MYITITRDQLELGDLFFALLGLLNNAEDHMVHVFPEIFFLIHCNPSLV